MNPIAIAAALSRFVTLTCPRCGHKKLVTARQAAHQSCRRCRRALPAPPPKPR